MLNQIKYYFSKNDYFYYITISLFIFIFLDRSKLFNYDNILSLLVTITIVYLLLNKFINNKKIKFNMLNSEIYEKFNFKKYPFLNYDFNILRVLGNLESIYKVNKVEYKNLLRSCNDFFKYYHDFLKTLAYRKQIFDLAYQSSKDILNNINNMGICVIDDTKEDLLKKNFSNVTQILSRYLLKLKNINNLELLNKNLNTSDNFIHYSLENGYEVYNDNYNVY